MSVNHTHKDKRPDTASAICWLIDDNPSDLFLSHVLLEDERVEMDIRDLEGGRAVMAALEAPEHEAAPDLIFMDLNMPDVNGTEILKKIRKNKKTESVPVFVLSGSDAEADRNTAKHLGATGYLVKPLSREKVRQAVEAGMNLTSREENGVYKVLCYKAAAPKRKITARKKVPAGA